MPPDSRQDVVKAKPAGAGERAKILGDNRQRYPGETFHLGAMESRYWRLISHKKAGHGYHKLTLPCRLWQCRKMKQE